MQEPAPNPAPKPPRAEKKATSRSERARATIRRALAAVLAGGALVVTSGCVREEPHNIALYDLQRTRIELWALKTRLGGLDHDARLLRLRMAEKDKRLADAGLVEAELMKRVDEAALLNAELSERLRKAGQSVKDLSGEKTELSKSLADTRVKLEELAKKQAAAEARLAQFQTLKSKFKKLVDDGKAHVLIRRGQMIVEIQSDRLFDPGKSQMHDDGKAILGDVAKILKTLEGRKFQVAGHTDNVKIEKAKVASSWELSTARAVEVTKVLVDRGMDPQVLSAGGFAEFAPAASNDTPEGRKKNRRMEIILLPTQEEIVNLPGVAELGDDALPDPPPKSASKTP